MVFSAAFPQGYQEDEPANPVFSKKPGGPNDL
jgi:hypothetical protein